MQHAQKKARVRKSRNNNRCGFFLVAHKKHARKTKSYILHYSNMRPRALSGKPNNTRKTHIHTRTQSQILSFYLSLSAHSTLSFFSFAATMPQKKRKLASIASQVTKCYKRLKFEQERGAAHHNVKVYLGKCNNEANCEMFQKTLAKMVLCMNQTQEGKKQLIEAIGVDALLSSWMINQSYTCVGKKRARRIMNTPLARANISNVCGQVDDERLQPKQTELQWRVACMLSERYSMPMHLRMPYSDSKKYGVKRVDRYYARFTDDRSYKFSDFHCNYYTKEGVYLETTVPFWLVRIYASLAAQKNNVPLALLKLIWHFVTPIKCHWLA